VGLDVYFRRDIGNGLRAAAAAHLGATGIAQQLIGDAGRAGISEQKALEIYQAGFLQALVAVGLSFGLEPATGATVRQVDAGRVEIPSWVETRQE